MNWQRGELRPETHGFRPRRNDERFCALPAQLPAQRIGDRIAQRLLRLAGPDPKELLLRSAGPGSPTSQPHAGRACSG